MLFKILKLFGLDVAAEVEATKAVIERRVDEVADRAKHLALSSAIIVALSTFAGLFCTMAIGVALFALYRTETAMYGINIALARRRGRAPRRCTDLGRRRGDGWKIIVSRAGIRACRRCGEVGPKGFRLWVFQPGTDLLACTVRNGNRFSQRPDRALSFPTG
jgi:hypothetical protein